MSKHQQHLSAEQRAAKKAAVLGTGKKARLPYIIIVCAALVAGGIVWYAVQGRSIASSATTLSVAPSQTITPTTQTTAATSPNAQNAQDAPVEQVTYPVSRFISGQAQFFTYQADKITIKYFIVRSVDGAIRAAFDACDVCWPAGKGYRQEGADMICNNCGRHFPISMVGDVQGGCNPAPLKNRVANDTLIIAVNDLQQGKSYFDLAQGGQ